MEPQPSRFRDVIRFVFDAVAKKYNSRKADRAIEREFGSFTIDGKGGFVNSDLCQKKKSKLGKPGSELMIAWSLIEWQLLDILGLFDRT